MQGIAPSSSTDTRNAMKFTEQGLQTVKTLEFARLVDKYCQPWREHGISELDLTKLLAAVVAWAATGQAIDNPPTGRQAYEFAAFALTNLADIDSVSSAVGDNLLRLRMPG